MFPGENISDLLKPFVRLSVLGDKIIGFTLLAELFELTLRKIREENYL